MAHGCARIYGHRVATQIRLLRAFSLSVFSLALSPAILCFAALLSKCIDTGSLPALSFSHNRNPYCVVLVERVKVGETPTAAKTLSPVRTCAPRLVCVCVCVCVCFRPCRSLVSCVDFLAGSGPDAEKERFASYIINMPHQRNTTVRCLYLRGCGESCLITPECRRHLKYSA